VIAFGSAFASACGTSASATVIGSSGTFLHSIDYYYSMMDKRTVYKNSFRENIMRF
jgi:hypothetical protein